VQRRAFLQLLSSLNIFPVEPINFIIIICNHAKNVELVSTDFSDLNDKGLEKQIQRCFKGIAMRIHNIPDHR